MLLFKYVIARIPLNTPVTTDKIRINGKYPITAFVPKIIIATNIWPTQWLIDPITDTPITEKNLNLENNHIKPKAKIPPDKLIKNVGVKILPLIIPTKNILAIFTANASLDLNSYNIIKIITY